MSESLALLFTDVVDSTRLNEELGDAAMATLWTSHDAAARELIEIWRGREVGRSDGFLVLFDSACDAVDFALAYHRKLANLTVPLAARVGVHVGSVSMRQNSVEDTRRGATLFEVDGVALPIAARVMAVARGRQTLLTKSARIALGATPLRVQSHGHWRFKGVTDPIELFEVGHAEAHFAAPLETPKGYRVVQDRGAWIAVREVPHCLPAERDGFVGRRQELELLARRFEQGAKLVSVVGIGGTGKTRLAARFALEAMGEFPGGVWFCDLSQARTADGVHFAVAQGIGVSLGSGDPVAQITEAIVGRRQCLVVLDNFEQVAREAERTVGCWLERAPNARFVVTTREVLGILGEEVLQLSPLEVDDAVELFSQRAAAARIGYVPSAKDMAAIRQIVKMLDGLPLAIELAAARVRAVPPHKLLARVQDRFELTLAQPGRSDRQSTLRATFDWSWGLLTEVERAALGSLSVFEGGFTLDSAAAVVRPAGPSSGPDILETTQRLLDKSLVRQLSDERYSLLEAVRDYASWRMRTKGSFRSSGESYASAAKARHWRHFAALNEREATSSCCVELNNLVAACRGAAEAGDGGAATRCLALAWAALRLTGPYQAALALAQTVAVSGSVSESDLSCIDWVASDALDMLGQAEASRVRLRQGIARARAAAATESLVRLLVVQGNRRTLDGDLDSAFADLQEASSLAAARRQTSLQMLALNELGRHFDHQARWAEAKDCFEKALELALALGDRRMGGGLLGNLGGLLHDQGKLDVARRQYERALELACELGDQRWEGNGRCNLGLLLQEQGQRDEARVQFERALRIARQVGHVRLEYTVLCNLGALLTAEGSLEQARAHLEQAVGAAQASGDKRCEGQFRGHLALNQARRGLVDEARASLDIAERLLLAMSDRLSHALLLCDRAEVEMLADHVSAAGLAIEKARGMAVELKCDNDSDLCRRLRALESRKGASA